MERVSTKLSGSPRAAQLGGLAESAREYMGLGLSILAVAGKKPVISAWTQYQERRPSSSEINAQLGRSGVTGLAVILGRVSGDLWAVDFDDAAVYRAWATEHPDLATTLPTVKSGRGFHVYGRWPAISTKKFAWGELRGEGAYIVLPPSLHPSGATYTWLTSDELRNIKKLNPEKLQLLKEIHVFQVFQGSHGFQGTQDSQVVLERGEDWVKKVVAVAIPTKTGENHPALFNLARASLQVEEDKRNHGELEDDERLSMNLLRMVFDEWMKAAQPFLRNTRQDYWAEFLAAWDCVRVPYGVDSLLNYLWEKAQRAKPPMVAEARFAGCPSLIQLCTFCREMARFNGEQPFFLSVSTVKKLFDFGSSRTAHTWLRALEVADIIKRVKTGTLDGRRATTYPTAHHWRTRGR